MAYNIHEYSVKNDAGRWIPCLALAVSKYTDVSLSEIRNDRNFVAGTIDGGHTNACHPGCMCLHPVHKYSKAGRIRQPAQFHTLGN